jgi:hypothetical protein
LVVAFASLVCSFGVTASRRSGCASHVPEDRLKVEAVFINSSLNERMVKGKGPFPCLGTKEAVVQLRELEEGQQQAALKGARCLAF